MNEIPRPTPAQIERAMHLRAQEPPQSWETIACGMGFGVAVLRSACDPEFAAQRKAWDMASLARRKERRAKERGGSPAQWGGARPRTNIHTVHEHPVLAQDIPHHVLLDRDHRLALAPRSLTAALCGDPLPGRSALDKRRNA